jgi:hypothetical protein
MSCRVKILVGIRSTETWSMQTQQRRVDVLVKVDIEIEAIVGHAGRKLPVIHAVGLTSL